jgi:hypothetical protein
MTPYPNTDLSGVSPDNLVEKELHTTTEARFRDYFFLIPNFAPFYIDNFKMWIKNGEALIPLIEDKDFSFALPYVTGTRTTGKQMYGAVTLHNLNLNGILVTDYQTIGGDQIADRLHVLTYLADKAYNPRTTVWDLITNVPNALPPVPHYQDYDTMYGQEQLVGMLAQVRDAIAANSSFTAQTIRDFLEAYGGESGGFLLRAGDAMTGQLTLAGMPTDPNHAANKQYVDQRLADQSSLVELLSHYVKDTDFHFNLNLKIDKAGGIMTGPLSLHQDPQQDDQATTKRYVDAVRSDLNQKLEQVNTLLQQLQNQVGGVTKQYVDSLVDDVVARFSTYK